MRGIKKQNLDKMATGGRPGGATQPNASILFLEKARPTHTSWKMDYLS